jgi:hypothetical protein
MKKIILLVVTAIVLFTSVSYAMERTKKILPKNIQQRR